MARYEIVREVVCRDDVGMNLKMALHNLDFFTEWMEELQSNIHSNRVSEMLTYRASFSTQNFVDELKKLMPGLFK